MATRGIRGATTVAADEPEVIRLATRELLQEIIKENDGIRAEDIASIFFTLTSDLCSTYPAQAAREMGLAMVPMMCAQEIPVPGALPKVIRVLVQWNTDTPQSEIRHVYLREAAKLRPDLCMPRPADLIGFEEKQS